jgi:uracil-DNA glycosylase family 4
VRVTCQPPRRSPCKLALLGDAPFCDWMGEVHFMKGDRLLTGALAAAGIERADCWVGNVLEESNHDTNAGNSDKLAAALDRLASEIAGCAPTVIVPLGGYALSTMLSGGSGTRGSPALANAVAPGTKLLPTYHPGDILAQYKLLPLFIGDLIKAAAEAEKGPELVVPWREFTVEPTLKDFEDWVHGSYKTLADSRGKLFPALSYCPWLSVDIETGWGQITSIAFAPDREHSICIPFVDPRKPSRSYWATHAEECEVWQLVKKVLESPVPKVGQNFSYDVYWLLTDMGIRVKNYCHDTRLMSHALYPELPKDLGSLAAAYSELPGWKSWGGRGKEEKRDA